MFWWVLKASFIKLTSYIINNSYFLECMQSAFSPKIRPVLISSSAIANHGLTTTFLATNGLAARVLRFRVQ